MFARRDGAGRDRILTVTRTADGTWAAPQLVTEEWATAPSWSSDGRWIAFTDPAGNLRVVDADWGTSRIVAEPVEVGGLPIRRPYWLFGELAMLARVEGPAGSGGIWRFSLFGEPPEEVVRFDDPTLPVYRTEVAADARSVYVVVSDFRSGTWRIPVEGRGSRPANTPTR